jgi:hypothetical protein
VTLLHPLLPRSNITSQVVLGLMAHFLDIHTGSKPRDIYTIVWAVFSVLLSLVWLLPFTSALLHAPVDFLLSLGWFGAFGLSVDWVHRIGCGKAFQWRGLTSGGRCGQWKAVEAFTFLSGVFWFTSALLAIWVHRKVDRRATVAE